MKKYFKEIAEILFLAISLILAILFIIVGKLYDNIILIAIGTINISTIIVLTVVIIHEKKEHNKIIHDLNKEIIEEHTSAIMSRMIYNQALLNIATFKKTIKLKNKRIENYEKEIKELNKKIDCMNNEAKELQDLCNRYEIQYGKLTDQE